MVMTHEYRHNVYALSSFRNPLLWEFVLGWKPVPSNIPIIMQIWTHDLKHWNRRAESGRMWICQQASSVECTFGIYIFTTRWKYFPYEMKMHYWNCVIALACLHQSCSRETIEDTVLISCLLSPSFRMTTSVLPMAWHFISHQTELHAWKWGTKRKIIT